MKPYNSRISEPSITASRQDGQNAKKNRNWSWRVETGFLKCHIGYHPPSKVTTRLPGLKTI